MKQLSNDRLRLSLDSNSPSHFPCASSMYIYAQRMTVIEKERLYGERFSHVRTEERDLSFRGSLPFNTQTVAVDINHSC